MAAAPGVEEGPGTGPVRSPNNVRDRVQHAPLLGTRKDATLDVVQVIIFVLLGVISFFLQLAVLSLPGPRGEPAPSRVDPAQRAGSGA